MKTQSRTESLAEALVNTLIGLAISMVANEIILPRYGTRLGLSNSLQISLAYTAVSVVRGYVLRRWFNARLRNAIHTVVKASH